MENEIKVWDYVVLCVGLILSLGTGMYYAFKDRHKNTSSRYHRGDGKLKFLPVAASIVLTVESTVMMLGFPAEVYVHGFIYCWWLLGLILGYLGCFWVSIPLFHPLKLTSVTQYLTLRHHSVVFNQYIVALKCINMTIYTGILTFGTSLAIAPILGFAPWAIIVILVVITVIYTALGGIKAVVAADVVQGVIVVIFAVGLLVYGTIRVGGVQKIVDINKRTGRFDILVSDINPFTRHTFWTLVIGSLVRTSSSAFFPPLVQRISSTKSVVEARKAMIVTIVAIAVIHLLFMSHGLVAYAYFSDKGCDPLAAKILSSPNQIIPFMVLDMFEEIPGITGLFLAALCSVSISTLSSLLNSISAMISVEIIRVRFKSISELNHIRVSKCIVLATGVFCIVVSIQFMYIKGPLTQIANSLVGAFVGPVIAIYSLSVFVKFITVKGLFVGCVVGQAFGYWLGFGYNFSKGRKKTPWMELGPTDKCALGRMMPNNSSAMGNMTMTNTPEANVEIEGINYLYSISYLYIAPMVLIVTVVTCLLVSWLTKPKLPIPIPEYLMLRFGIECLKCTTKKPENEELLLDKICAHEVQVQSQEL